METQFPPELVAAAQAGDTDAREELYRYALLHVRNYVSRWIAPVYRYALEDITSETVMCVVRDLPHYEDRGYSFTAWLNTIARSRIIDHSRRFHARYTDPMPPFFDAPTNENIEELVTTRDNAAAVWALRTCLTPLQRHAVEMYYGREQPIDVIAQQVGSPKSSIKAQLRRARWAIRRHADALGIQP